MSKKDGRSLSPEAQETIRLRAVGAVQSGMKIKDAARVFAVHRGTISMWLKKRREGGGASLRKKSRGRPTGTGKLQPKQADEIRALIAAQTPQELGLPYAKWTRKAVQALVTNKFDVQISRMTVWRWFRNRGRPLETRKIRETVPGRPGRVRRWLRRTRGKTEAPEE